MRPEALHEGPCEAGIGQRRGCDDRINVLRGTRIPLWGDALKRSMRDPRSGIMPRKGCRDRCVTRRRPTRLISDRIFLRKTLLRPWAVALHLLRPTSMHSAVG